MTATHSPMTFADQIIPTLTPEYLEGLEYLDSAGLREEVAMWVHSTVKCYLGLPASDDLSQAFPNSETWTVEDIEKIKRLSTEA